MSFAVRGADGLRISETLRATWVFFLHARLPTVVSDLEDDLSPRRLPGELGQGEDGADQLLAIEQHTIVVVGAGRLDRVVQA